MYSSSRLGRRTLPEEASSSRRSAVTIGSCLMGVLSAWARGSEAPPHQPSSDVAPAERAFSRACWAVLAGYPSPSGLQRIVVGPARPGLAAAGATLSRSSNTSLSASLRPTPGTAVRARRSPSRGRESGHRPRGPRGSSARAWAHARHALHEREEPLLLGRGEAVEAQLVLADHSDYPEPRLTAGCRQAGIRGERHSHAVAHATDLEDHLPGRPARRGPRGSRSP